MPLIKGNHGKVRIAEQQETTRGLIHPNQSFGYLTFDADTVSASTLSEAMMPRDNPSLVINLLKDLGAAMIEESDHDSGNSSIPPLYTYWGQFIDHDITAGTDRPGVQAQSVWTTDILDAEFSPVEPQNVIGSEGIYNLRLPNLDLDSVYGDGPADSHTINEQIFLKDVPGSAAGINDPRLHLGQNSGSIHDAPHSDLPEPLRRDLPRHVDKSPRIGDERNDENTIVAQFHTAFLRFHNAVVDYLEGLQGSTPDFDEVAQLVRWHYQWLIVNDYLPTVCMPNVVDEIVASGDHFFSEREHLFMPLEFSVAGYRFGHSMVRANYDFNQNFSPTSFFNLFAFTGNGGFLGGESLPAIWIIDWERFTDKESNNPLRFARKIDTNLAMPLSNLPGGASALEKHLAQRNLLRGYLLSVPSAQFVADWLDVPMIAAEHLVSDDKPAIQAIFDSEGGMLKTHTPLWYYVLREAESQTGGNSLGELGSRLVAGTLISLLKADPDSYLNHGWTPSSETAVQVDGKPIDSIGRFLHFSGVAPALKDQKTFFPFVAG